jgi:hypothetical protein
MEPIADRKSEETATPTRYLSLIDPARSRCMTATLPTEDLRVTSTAPTPGASVSYTINVRGVGVGTGRVTTEMEGPDLPGVTIVTSEVAISRH